MEFLSPMHIDWRGGSKNMYISIYVWHFFANGV